MACFGNSNTDKGNFKPSCRLNIILFTTSI